MAKEFVSEYKMKQQLCDIGRRIWLKGFCAGNEGNHSYRMGPNRFLCTPTGISKGNLNPEDICVVDGDGKQISGRLKRTSEFLLHATIYKARPDVNAVIHSHPPHATAFAIAGVEIPTCIHPEAEVFLGPVKTARYVTPGDTRLGESILPFVKDSNTIVLGNHGVVCFDSDIEQCYYKLEIIDAYTRILLLTKQLGSVNTLSGPEMSELIQLKGKFGLPDPRMDQAKAGAIACTASDFVQRVAGNNRARTMVASEGGQTLSTIQRTIESMAPSHFDEAQAEQLVQVITDQIMASL